MAKERHPVAFVLGAAIGGTIGAVIGLMNAPRPGVETRANLTERWHDVEERTAEGIATLEADVRDRIAPEWAPRSDLRVTHDSPAQARAAAHGAPGLD